jgi:hypothetical protein
MGNGRKADMCMCAMPSAPVQSVYFVTASSPPYPVTDGPSPPAGHRDAAETSPVDLTFIAGIAGTLRCVAVGGYPPPELTVRLGGQDLTDRLAVSHTAELVGEPGLRLMLYRTERAAEGLTVGAAGVLDGQNPDGRGQGRRQDAELCGVGVGHRVGRGEVKTASAP